MPLTQPGAALQLSPCSDQHRLIVLQELNYWAEGSPDNLLRRNTNDVIPTLYEDAFNDPGDGWEGSGNLVTTKATSSPGAATNSPGPSPLGQAPSSPGVDPAHLTSQSPSQQQADAKTAEDSDSFFSVKGISSEQLPCMPVASCTHCCSRHHYCPLAIAIAADHVNLASAE